MRKLLFIAALFLNFSASSQGLDTIIIKNNYTYKFMKTNSLDGLSMMNETTHEALSELPKNRVTESEALIEYEHVKKHMRSNGETNIFKCFLNIFKETFKDCPLKKFEHTNSITFILSVSSNGDIIDLQVILNKNFLDIVGYDRFIEFESKIRKEYKFKPFINTEVGALHFITVNLKNTQLNEVFK